MITLLLLVALASMAFFYLKKASERPPNFPPGLPKFPIAGSLPILSLIGRKRDTLPSLARAMGPIVGLFIRHKPAVLISDVQLIREAFKQDTFSDRIATKPFNEINLGGDDGQSRGVLGSNGSEWREQRRFALRNLRDFGFGKSSMDDMIIHEVEKLVDFLAKDIGEPVMLHNKMNLSIVNALWVVLTGEHLSLEDERLHHIVKIIDDALREPTAGLQGINITGLLNIPWLIRRYNRSFIHFKKGFSAINNLVAQVLRQHQDEFEEDNLKDFMDIYIKEMKNCKDPTSSFHGEMGEKSMLAVFADLFVAGMETTSSSLLWSFLYLLKWPEVKHRVHDELDKVVGRHHTVTMADEENLPYIKAFILESMRLTSLVPSSLAHVTNKETTIGNYTLPKETIVMANLMHVHRDGTYWKDPESLKPERFLSDDGKTVVQDDHLIPFSVGKRFCLGQTLAEKEYFLFFANLLNKFDMTKVPNDPLPSIDPLHDPTTGAVRTAPIFKMILTRRT